MTNITSLPTPARLLTPKDGHYFFSYYDKLQFSPDDRYVLAQKAQFDDHPPRAGDVLEVGFVDLLENDRWQALGTTASWCWQQGCMLQWLPQQGSRAIFNTQEDTHYESMIVDEKAVAICASVRISNAAHEAGVATLASFQKQGFASSVVSSWACAVREKGALPLYSTSNENIASQSVAARLGLSEYGADFHIT